MKEVKLIKQNGMMKIMVGDEILEPAGYMTYNVDGDQFGAMEEMGNRIVFFGAYATDMGLNSLAGSKAWGPHYYLDYNTFDFTEIDRILEMIAPHGKGPYIIPRVYFCTPSWWERDNPDEVCRVQSGESARESFGSKKWRNDMWSAVKALIDHINDSVWKDLIIGYHVCAGSTEEWGHHGHKHQNDMADYSKVNQACFHEWLLEKYGSVEAVNCAWSSSYKVLSEIPIPRVVERTHALGGIVRDLKREQHVVDYNAFISDQIAETILWFAEKVKTYTGRKLLVGCFYGYINHHVDAAHGSYSVYKILQSPDIDFLCTTNELGRMYSFYTAVDSIRLHNKLYICEGDTRTSLTTCLGEKLPKAEPDNTYYKIGGWVAPDFDTSIGNLKRTSLLALTGHVGLWWFDMWGGWFDHPEYKKIIRMHQALCAAQTEGPIRAEIAVIVDEGGVKHFQSPDTLRYAVKLQLLEMGLVGAPYHIYLASDLPNDDFPADDYKVYIFTHFCRCSKDIENAIEQKLKRGNKILIWTHFAGFERGALTDYEVAYDLNQPDLMCQIRQADFPIFTDPFFPKTTGKFDEYPNQALPCCRFVSGTEENAYILGRGTENREPALLWKQFSDYASVYSLCPCLPARVLQKIVIQSGVHVYSLTRDVLMAGGKYILLRAMTEGQKRIHYPDPTKKIVDVYTGEVMENNDSLIDFWLKNDEVKVLEVVD